MAYFPGQRREIRPQAWWNEASSDLRLTKSGPNLLGSTWNLSSSSVRAASSRRNLVCASKSRLSSGRNQTNSSRNLTGSRWNLVRPGWEKDPANREIRENRPASSFCLCPPPKRQRRGIVVESKPPIVPQKFLFRIRWGEGGRRPDEVNREPRQTRERGLTLINLPRTLSAWQKSLLLPNSV